MKQLLKGNEPCAICRVNRATETKLESVDFMGRKLPVVLALCRDCDKRADRDVVLAGYLESIFSGGMKQ